MRAWILEQPGPIDAMPLVRGELPTPEPGPGEVRVRVSVCGLCRTDLHILAGEVRCPRYPIVPGHQIIGRVDRRGPGAERFDLGARIGIAWLRHTCGECEHCQRGDENLCRASRYTGCDAHGGFAEWAVVPEEFAYAIPERFADEKAAPLLCAGIIGYRALRRSQARPGELLGLYGFGSSAHLMLQVARHRGIELAVVTRGERNRELARRLGAEWVGGPGEEPPRPLDRAVIFAPAGELVPAALEALRPGGTVACAGIHMSEIPPLDYTRHLFDERTLTSVTANTRRDGEELLEVAAEIPIEVDTTPVPFANVDRGLRDIFEDRARGSSVMIGLPS